MQSGIRWVPRRLMAFVMLLSWSRGIYMRCIPGCFDGGFFARKDWLSRHVTQLATGPAVRQPQMRLSRGWGGVPRFHRRCLSLPASSVGVRSIVLDQGNEKARHDVSMIDVDATLTTRSFDGTTTKHGTPTAASQW